MQLERGRFRCDHCGEEFPRRHLCGRKPQYCGRTCRQRAYEARRRGQLRRGLPTTDLVAHHSWLRRPPRYEPAISRGRVHQLRTEGVPDPRRFRPTLCGAYAKPLPIHGQHRHRPACGTCHRVAQRHPPTRFFDPATDIAVLRSLIARFRVPGDDEAIVAELLGYCSSQGATGEVTRPR